MTRKSSLQFALRRTLSSLIAIAAISAIFGAKALESEHLAHPADVETARIVSSDPMLRKQ